MSDDNFAAATLALTRLKEAGFQPEEVPGAEHVLGLRFTRTFDRKYPDFKDEVVVLDEDKCSARRSVKNALPLIEFGTVVAVVAKVLNWPPLESSEDTT